VYYIIYETKNLINGKIYRGCHQTNNLDDGYLGSGIAFSRALSKYKKQNFSRTILKMCDSFEDMIESEKIFVDEEFVKRNDTYNLQTGGLCAGILCEESKKKISESVKLAHNRGDYKDVIRTYVASKETNEKISNTLKERYKTQEHHLKGKLPWCAGTTGLVIPWNKGISTGPMDVEQKNKISETLKERYKEVEHPRTGVDPWNKGKNGSQVAWNKGKTANKIICQHCNKTVGGESNFKRWHGDNCKLFSKIET
jgi:hypothetical protein